VACFSSLTRAYQEKPYMGYLSERERAAVARKAIESAETISEWIRNAVRRPEILIPLLRSPAEINENNKFGGSCLRGQDSKPIQLLVASNDSMK
jgi:hypothetical protein